MTPSIIIQLDQLTPYFQPGDVLTGTYRFVDISPEEIQRMEFSILWYTEGKGDEDLGVHHFESVARDTDEQFADFLQEFEQSPTFQFAVKLPTSPLSYYGKILKIHWCVRVRLYLRSGREISSERIFQFGNLPPLEVSLN